MIKSELKGKTLNGPKEFVHDCSLITGVTLHTHDLIIRVVETSAILLGNSLTCTIAFTEIQNFMLSLFLLYWGRGGSAAYFLRLCKND